LHASDLLQHDPELPQAPAGTAYLVVTPEQYAQYYNGQPILPIQVLLPAPKPQSATLFDKTHDLVAKILRFGGE